MGKSDWLLQGGAPPAALRRLHRRTLLEGSSGAFISVDGVVEGALILEDPVRTDAPLTLRALRRAGFEQIVMLTGDHEDVARAVGSVLGVNQVLAERSPAEKLEAVQAAQRTAVTVMVGDGINDAPALAAADVGVAIGARGATASSEAADVVLVVDRLDRLVEAIRIARRSRSIALQSVFLGMGLSIAAMGLAAGGLLSPVAGALLQEVIDVIVILNALRALKSGHSVGQAKPRRRVSANSVARNTANYGQRSNESGTSQIAWMCCRRKRRVEKSNRFTGSSRRRSCHTTPQRMPPSTPQWRG